MQRFKVYYYDGKRENGREEDFVLAKDERSALKNFFLKHPGIDRKNVESVELASGQENRKRESEIYLSSRASGNKKYWLMESDRGQIELIKQGFSWPALISSLFGFFPFGTVLWLFYRRLWMVGLSWFGIILVSVIPISIISAYASGSPRSSDTSSGLIILLIALFLVVFPGYKANEWTMLNRLKNGYKDIGEIEAESDVEAIKRVRQAKGTGVHIRS